MDDGGSIAPWLISVLLILFADFIAISETSLSSVSKVRIKTLADRGNSRAQTVLGLLENFDRTISTILICTNIAHMAIASIVTVAVTRQWGLSAVSISTIITSLVVFFAGEMLPKSIAKKYAESFSLATAKPLQFLTVVFKPASAILAAIGNYASSLTKGDPEVSVTENELYDIIEDMTEEGSLDEDQGDLISSAIQFNTVTVESVLTPRVDVVAINIADDKDHILDQIKNQNHSRLPVYEGNIDNIIGILMIRQYIRAYLKDRESLDIRKLVEPVMFCTENANIDDLLPEMSRNKQSMCVVTDHYGGTVGIVTIEDIVEELVGDIWDEDDQVENPIMMLADGSYLVDAEEITGPVLEEIEFDYPDKDDEELQDTKVGEWVFNHFTKIPKVNDTFEYNGLQVSVARMEHNRIRKVRIKLPQKAKEGGDDE